MKYFMSGFDIECKNLLTYYQCGRLKTTWINLQLILR